MEEWAHIELPVIGINPEAFVTAVAFPKHVSMKLHASTVEGVSLILVVEWLKIVALELNVTILLTLKKPP